MERVERYRNISKLSLRHTNFVRRTAHFYCWECGQSSCQVHQRRHSINMETQFTRLTETLRELRKNLYKWQKMISCVFLYLSIHGWSERSSCDCEQNRSERSPTAEYHSQDLLRPRVIRVSRQILSVSSSSEGADGHASHSAYSAAILRAFLISPCHLGRDPKSRASSAMLNGERFDWDRMRKAKNVNDWPQVWGHKWHKSGENKTAQTWLASPKCSIFLDCLRHQGARENAFCQLCSLSCEQIEQLYSMQLSNEFRRNKFTNSELGLVIVTAINRWSIHINTIPIIPTYN